VIERPACFAGPEDEGTAESLKLSENANKRKAASKTAATAKNIIPYLFPPLKTAQ